MPRDPLRWPAGLVLLNTLLPAPTLHRRVFLSVFLFIVASIIFGIVSWQDDFGGYAPVSALVLLCILLVCVPLPIIGRFSLFCSQTEDRPTHARLSAGRAPPSSQQV